MPRKNPFARKKQGSYEPAPDLTYGDLEVLMSGGNQNYESRMKIFMDELVEREKPSRSMVYEPAPDISSPMDTTTPVRPKLPDNETGDRTPVRPPIPFELPNPTSLNTGGKRRPKISPPSPPTEPGMYGRSPPTVSPSHSPIPHGGRNGRRSPSPPVTVVETPHSRKSIKSPGVPWPLPPSVPIDQMVAVYTTVMEMVSRRIPLNLQSIEGLKRSPAEKYAMAQWVFIPESMKQEDNIELLELVQMYRIDETGEIPWEVVGAEMRSLTTAPLVERYELLSSTGLELKPYTRKEDVAILSTTKTYPTAPDLFTRITKALAENGSIRTHRSAMRRLLVLIGSHFHPQSDEMLARNNLREAVKKTLNADQVNLLIELKKEYPGDNWKSMAHVFGISGSALQRLYMDSDLRTASSAPWTDREDQKLLNSIKYLGSKKMWPEIAVMMRKRSPESCRKRNEKLKVGMK